MKLDRASQGIALLDGHARAGKEPPVGQVANHLGGFVIQAGDGKLAVGGRVQEGDGVVAGGGVNRMSVRAGVREPRAVARRFSSSGEKACSSRQAWS